MSTDLAALAAETSAQLREVWALIGCAQPEQDAFLTDLTARVAAVYKDAVAGQEARQRGIEAEIESLQATIRSLNAAMGEMADGIPAGGHLSLSAYRTVLERTRGEAQAAWDAREATLQRLRTAVAAAARAVDEPLAEEFSAVGDAKTAARIGAFKAELRRLRALRSERGAAIAALCTEVADLYADYEGAPKAEGQAGVEGQAESEEALARAAVAAAEASTDVEAAEAAAAAHGLDTLLEVEVAGADVCATDAAGAAAPVTRTFGWGASIIARLQARVAALTAEVEAREARITALGAQLTHYWHRLATPEEEQRAFLARYAGISDAIFAAVESAVASMRADFTSRLTELIGKARAAIAAAWDEMRAGPASRAEMFPAFYAPIPSPDAPAAAAAASASATAEGGAGAGAGAAAGVAAAGGSAAEALFAEHEAYLAVLRVSLEDMRPILRGLEKRDELLRDKGEYAAIVADASRLLARGSSAARLREEKLERRVKKELPAVLKRLRETVREWEAGTGRPFLVDDVRFIDTLDEEEAREAREKGEARAARHGGGAGAGAGAATASLSATGGAASLSSSGILPAGAGAAGASSSAAGATGRSTSNGRASVYTATGSGAAAAAAVAPRSAAAASAASASAGGASAPASRKASVTGATGSIAAAAAAATAAATADVSAAAAAVAASPVADENAGVEAAAAAPATAAPAATTTAAAERPAVIKATIKRVIGSSAAAASGSTVAAPAVPLRDASASAAAAPVASASTVVASKARTAALATAKPRAAAVGAAATPAAGPAEAPAAVHVSEAARVSAAKMLQSM